MIDYEDHTEVLNSLAADQGADKDRREKVREVEAFLDKPDGQWEPRIIKKFDGFNRPRYTFDRCSPVVEAIWGEMAQNDFDIRVRPAGGDATKELAKTFDGIVRNIETISEANQVYTHNGKKIIRSGFGAWRVKQAWVDGDSFNQDLIIENIPNAVDRVWLDQGFEKQTGEDANHINVLQNITLDAYDRLLEDLKESQDLDPDIKLERSSISDRIKTTPTAMSVSEDRSFDLYHYKREGVTVGELWYKQKTKKKLWLIPVDIPEHQLKAGAVIDNEKIVDELEAIVGSPLKFRERNVMEIKSRLYDGSRWLSDISDSVFKQIPIVPVFAHFSVSENKVLYRGAIEKLIDQQRVLNYAGSKEVEDIAFSPRAKYWLTDKNAEDQEAELQTLNTNSDPVQLFTPDAENPQGPRFMGGTAVNPASQQLISNMEQGIERSAGLFGVNPQNNSGLQSGVALERLENRGQTGTYEYFEGTRIAKCYTGKILVDAIPSVYDTEQQMRILNEDGSFEMVSINGQRIIDEQSGEAIEPIDLSIGKYDVTCEIGPAFKNRQSQTARAIVELGQVDPDIIRQNSDILAGNINSPGMDLVAERARALNLQQGMIPKSQLTDEEKAQLQEAAGQPKEPTPEMVLAQAESKKGDADLMNAENDNLRLQLEASKLQLKAEDQQASQSKDAAELMLEQQSQQFDVLKKQAETLTELANGFKAWREGMGVDQLVGPNAMEAAVQQAEIGNEVTEQVLETLPTQ
jgi:hypothetical protein